MPAFNTASGIPFSDVNLQTRRARGPAWNPDSSTAEVATLQLEFNQLSYASGDLQYSVSDGGMYCQLQYLLVIGGG